MCFYLKFTKFACENKDNAKYIANLMKLQLRFLFLFVISIFALGAGAAVPQRLYFNHYTNRDGLTQNSVNFLLQDKQGFIWVATKDGLNRFDGFRFRHVDTDGGESCSFTITLYEDSDGFIWVGAHNGVFIYDPGTERLRKLKPENGVQITKPVTEFLPGRDGSMLMLVESEGAYHYDKRTEELEKRYGSETVKPMHAVRDPNGRIWVGSFGQGLYFSDDELRSLNEFSDQGDNGRFASCIIGDLAMKGDKLYVATQRDGLHVIDVRTGKAREIDVRDEDGGKPFMRQLMFDDSGSLYIASESGVFVYDIHENRLSNHLTHNLFDRYSISDNAVYALLCDRESGLWVGSYFGGIDYGDMSRMKFDKYYPVNSSGSLKGQRIRELCEDRETGLIYVGSEDQGLSCFNPVTGQFAAVDGVTGKNIHALCIDGRKLWVGTFSQGLLTKDLDTGRIREYSSSDGLNSDHVFSVKRTLHGDLIIGTMSGLEVYNRKTDRFESVPELENIFIYDILEDSHGNLWVATYDKGLYLRRAGRKSWSRFRWDSSNPAGMPSDKVYGLYEDACGILWIMTQDGICAYDNNTNTFSRKYLGTDRVKGVVYQMVDDDLGRMWLTTNHGLYCLERKSGKLQSFSVAQGLPTNQFNYRSSLKASDGRIYIGTIDGLVAFHPMNFSFNPKPMTPVISELYLHGSLVRPGEKPLPSSISTTDRLRLKSNQNSIAFRIVSLQYSSPGDQEIKYMLEGFDKEWRYTSLKDAVLSYPNLEYGKYLLKVVPHNEFGEDSGEGVDLIIEIATPVYLSWWAIIIYVLLTVSVVFVILHQYRRNARLRNQRYMETYKLEKEREANDSKIRFFTNVAHEIRTPLTLIKAPLDSVSKVTSVVSDPEVKENLDVIHLNVNRLLLLANQLLDFRKMEDGKFQIMKSTADIKTILENCITRFRPTVESAGERLEISIPDQPVMAVVDSEAITKIISNLFTNAIKYGKSYIKVRLDADESGFSITIANDGDVVAPDKREEIFSLFTRLDNKSSIPGTGLGLAYSRSLAQMHGGSLAMTDNETENEFKLTVPLAAADTEETAKEEKAADDIEKMIKRAEKSSCILVVDDNVEMLSFIEKKLIAAGHRVIKACDGAAALEILADEYVDIVVSDVMMPGIDGIELLSRIKSDVNYSHIPVILLTAKTRMEDKLAGLDSGADAYIEKPFSIEYLLANIMMLLGNRERMRQRLEHMPFTKATGKGLSKVDQEFLRKINEIIQANFNNSEFSMEDVIATMGMSRTSFYRKIKGMLDLNPNEYIKIERLKRAAQLFDEGHSGVSEVCYMVGFSSPGYFTKCFQKQFGISPKEYIGRLSKKKAE